MKQFYLSAKAGIRHRCGLATSTGRDQFQLVAAFCLILSWVVSLECRAETMLNVLTQPQRLDSRLVKEFEAATKISVRVEFVTSPLEYEAKIRSLPNSWDVVFADEQRLVRLNDEKLLKPIPDSVLIPPNLMGLSRRSRTNADGRAYINLMADPIGVMYLAETKASKGTIDWNWLIDPVVNPLWRSRIALFKDERLNLMVAAKAAGHDFPIESDEKRKDLLNWMTLAKLQGRTVEFNQAVTAFLAKKLVAGLSWQSDYLIASRYVKNLAFAVPTSGTYFERIGVALVTGTRSEAAALQFVKFINDKRDELAKQRGLLPLHSSELTGSNVRNWRVFTDDIVWFNGRSGAAEKLLQGIESLSQRYKRQ